MTLAHRYVTPVALLLAGALIPTVMHSYADVRRDSGPTAQTVEQHLFAVRSRASDRTDRWVRRTFAAVDWMERWYTVGDRELLLFVARSYDHKRLYHHPELALVKGVDLEENGLAALPDGGRAQQLKARPGSRGAAAYALVYEGQTVTDPLFVQLRSVTTELLKPRLPMTLVFVFDSSTPITTTDDAALQLLSRTVQQLTNPPR